jgi:hypothetical protein
MPRSTRHRCAVIAVCAASVLALTHCSGGQSGHEGVATPPSFEPPTQPDASFGNCGFRNCPGDIWHVSPCGCEAFVGRSALRAVVTAFAPGVVELEIRSSLASGGCMSANPDAGAGCGLAEGDRLRAAWHGRLPCAEYCAEIAPGEEVFALYDPASAALDLIRARDAEFGDRLDLGSGRVFDADVALLVAGGATCRAAVEEASGNRIQPDPTGVEPDSQSPTMPAADIAPQLECPLVEERSDAGPPVLSEPPFLDQVHVCADSVSGAPIDCLDVCGALVHCDAQIACDACMSRCLASPPARQNVRCLSYAIYSIDEEGCGRMVEQYRAFDDDYECPPPG